MRIDRRRREAAGEREAELSRRERKRVPSRARLTCAHGKGGQRAAPEAQECILELVARAERARGTHNGRDEPLEVDRQLLHRPRRPSTRSAGPPCARGARVSSSSRLRGVSRSRRGRGKAEEGGQQEEAGRTRTHLLSRSRTARPACSQRALHRLDPRRGASTSLRVVAASRERSVDAAR